MNKKYFYLLILPLACLVYFNMPVHKAFACWSSSQDMLGESVSGGACATANYATSTINVGTTVDFGNTTSTMNWGYAGCCNTIMLLWDSGGSSYANGFDSVSSTIVVVGDYESLAGTSGFGCSTCSMNDMSLTPSGNGTYWLYNTMTAAVPTPNCTIGVTFASCGYVFGGDQISAIGFNYSGSVPSSTVDFTIAYPHATSTPINNFDNFGFISGNATESDGYSIFTTLIINSTTFSSTYDVLTDGYSLNNGLLVAANLIGRDIRSNFSTNATTSAWTLTAFLFDNTLATTVASSVRNYNIINPFIGSSTQPIDIIGFVDGTSTVVGSSTQPNSYNGAFICEKPTDWTDWGGDLGYAFCQTLSFFFNPSSGSVDTFYSSFTAINKVPPFSLFLNFSDAIQAVIAQDQATTTDYSSLKFNQDTTVFGTSSIVLMTSSSLASFIGQDAKDMLFVDIEYALWIILGLLIALSIYHKFSNS